MALQMLTGEGFGKHFLKKNIRVPNHYHRFSEN
jgi:hypothetical protein